ncbi:helix-turn-helix transcriptional regulator [Victivallis vadensis]|uniref:Helix-turn-helix transcriptional regulator n=1 Tax=Victivallis vadensis TaxID=172901 RepID=A0A2U1B996_9BACT|nr:helix-turn-helix transcriptional regulator [Victivallis vadensis]NMD89414.1 helix-turn-helix transcriptional regulator [Victivallis vadensis]PVY45240.1 hypothetical protein C8D82_103154 [Victivallis vadensis]
MTEQNFSDALWEAYRRAGTQQCLAKQIGIPQSTIAGYFSGRYSIGNMTVSTLIKLFPDMAIDFWGSDTFDEEPMRDELLEIFDSLGPRDRARCLALLAAHFGDKLREEPQPAKKVAGSQVS